MVRVHDLDSRISIEVTRKEGPLAASAVIKAFTKKYREKFEGKECTLNCLSSIDGRRMLDGDVSTINEALMVKRSSEIVSVRCQSKKEKLRRIAYIGGSITQQIEGWRPRIHAMLEKRAGHRIEAVDIFCGNAGSTLLAFLVREKLEKAVDLVFLEVAVNDGDVLLEARKDADKEVRQALEGIVRALAPTPIIMVEMFLRNDLASHQRSGTQAWVHAEDMKSTAQIYSRDVVALHATIAAHYPWCAQLDLNKIFVSLNSNQRDCLFRDDCHHTQEGATFVARAVFDAINHNDFWLSFRESTLPIPLETSFWRPQCAKRFELSDIVQQGRNITAPRVLRGDRCPLTGNPSTWIWLHPGDAIDCSFSGRGLAIVTCVGPDSGRIKVTELSSATSDSHQTTAIIDLVDRWCYYWRTTIIRLWTGPQGDHRIRIEPCDPSLSPKASSRWKRPVTDPRFLQDQPPGLAKAPKLWLMWFCVFD